MRAWRVLLTSVVVHATGFAIAIAWRWHAASVTATPPPAPSDIIEVAFLDVQPSSPPAAATSHGATATARPGPAKIAIATATPTATPAATATGAPGTPGEPPSLTQPTRSLGMRGPELHPSDAALEHIADAPGHDGAKLHPQLALDSVLNGREAMHVPGTTMVVERDGAAHFNDAADIDAHLELTPTALKNQAAALRTQVKEWLVDPEAFKRAGRTQDLPNTLRAVEGGCSSWGDAMCDASDTGAHDKLARTSHGFTRVPILGGNLDMTSYLMRKLHIGDPLASRKLALLDATRDQRAERGASFNQEQLDHAAILMQQNLEHLWASTHDLAERRAVLFELWDECAEGESPIGIAGDRGRAMVIGWIRSHVPAGQPGAFTATEAATLDLHRASRQHFAPY